MPGGRPEPGGDQERAEPTAVQRGGMRLIIQPRAADMRGRGVLKEFFPDCVPAEPGDDAQPPGDGGTGTALGPQVPGEDLDVSTPDPEQGQRAGTASAVNCRKSREYASRVRPGSPGSVWLSEAVLSRRAPDSRRVVFACGSGHGVRG